MAKLNFPLQFQRQYNGPIDKDMVFDTTSDMNDYLTNSRRYAGMVVTCAEQEGKVFILNNARDNWLEMDVSVEDATTSVKGIVQLSDVVLLANLGDSDNVITESTLKDILEALEPSDINAVEDVTGDTKIWRGDQAAYDAIDPKDDDTVYLISGTLAETANSFFLGSTELTIEDGVVTIPISTDINADGSSDEKAVSPKAVKDYVDDRVAMVYKASGSLTSAELDDSLLIEDNLGNVYNISEDFTTTDDFLQGAGTSHSAGTNVAIVSDGGDYKFDVLSGTIDVVDATTGQKGIVQLSDSATLGDLGDNDDAITEDVLKDIFNDQKGQDDGLATLGSGGKVPKGQLADYVFGGLQFAFIITDSTITNPSDTLYTQNNSKQNFWDQSSTPKEDIGSFWVVDNSTGLTISDDSSGPPIKIYNGFNGDPVLIDDTDSVHIPDGNILVFIGNDLGGETETTSTRYFMVIGKRKVSSVDNYEDLQYDVDTGHIIDVQVLYDVLNTYEMPSSRVTHDGSDVETVLNDIELVLDDLTGE